MPTDARKNETWEDWEAQQKAEQEAIANFRYSDAQREQVITFIGAAMNVIRGDTEFDSLTRLLNLKGVYVESGDIQANRKGSSYWFDSSFLNKRTQIYMIATSDAQGKIEPYHFQIYFSPSIPIPRTRLEQLLQLKIVSGSSLSGGNWQFNPRNHLDFPGYNAENFVYELIEQPDKPYTVQVELDYFNGADHNPYNAVDLYSLEIRREYLTPEEIRDRDRKKRSHLPSTGQRVPMSGRWIGLFASDELNASIPEHERIFNLAEGTTFPPLWLRLSSETIRRLAIDLQPSWWQWYG